MLYIYMYIPPGNLPGTYIIGVETERWLKTIGRPTAPHDLGIANSAPHPPKHHRNGKVDGHWVPPTAKRFT